ncbi:MbtH family NRPS accessory protein [Bradyrhizobium sp. Ai1a-2]|uniref:MbtH family protein n=1 Tax=Bradyrhizobium sp. Ai1a-2 TaxID=196490 RepID=UPI000A043BDD|nr:MbtH family NRPS accessory protein [Bradyrhizobium sp. Ai1a-2]
MNGSPFDDEAGSFRVLRNDEGQYSLWPEVMDIPEGWSAKYGPNTKAVCLAYIEENWTDMRPNSLVTTMERWRTSKDQN